MVVGQFSCSVREAGKSRKGVEEWMDKEMTQAMWLVRYFR